MKKIIMIISTILITACDQAVIKGNIKTVDSSYLNYLCIDNVKYIKSTTQTGHSSLTAKFREDGRVELCN